MCAAAGCAWWRLTTTRTSRAPCPTAVHPELAAAWLAVPRIDPQEPAGDAHLGVLDLAEVVDPGSLAASAAVPGAVLDAAPRTAGRTPGRPAGVTRLEIVVGDQRPPALGGPAVAEGDVRRERSAETADVHGIGR